MGDNKTPPPNPGKQPSPKTTNVIPAFPLDQKSNNDWLPRPGTKGTEKRQDR